VAFAGKYLKRGALATFELDPADMGRQAGRIARRILDGTPVEQVAPELPAKAALRVNRSVAQHLGIPLKLYGE
jgi:putative ABC transport system substrate-binding protein